MWDLLKLGSLTWSIIVIFAAPVIAAEPTTKPEKGQEQAFVLTPMRVQTLQPVGEFIYAETETTFADLKTAIDKLMRPIEAACAAGKINPEGGYIFVYHGASSDMTKRFKLQIGRPVKSGSAPDVEGMKVRKLEAIRAATVVYSGGVEHMGRAFEKLYADLFAAGLTPTDECREHYLYWEGENSPNNVVILQAGLK